MIHNATNENLLDSLCEMTGTGGKKTASYEVVRNEILRRMGGDDEQKSERERDTGIAE